MPLEPERRGSDCAERVKGQSTLEEHCDGGTQRVNTTSDEIEDEDEQDEWRRSIGEFQRQVGRLQPG